MSNMSYCRFHNTVLDLQDCKDALEEYEDHVHDRQRLKDAKALIADYDEKRPDGFGDNGPNDAFDENYEAALELVDDIERKGGEISESERGQARALIELCRNIVDEFESIDLES